MAFSLLNLKFYLVVESSLAILSVYDPESFWDALILAQLANQIMISSVLFFYQWDTNILCYRCQNSAATQRATGKVACYLAENL